MSERDNGGAAFPVHGGHHADDDPRNHTLGGGMTLRDWFAGQALAGMAGTTTRVMYDEGYGVQDIKAAMVRQAYGIADAMLEARK